MPKLRIKGLLDLVDIMGRDPALALSQELGGDKLYIPKKVTGAHRLAKCVGLEAAKKLCEIYGGSNLEITRAWDVRIAKRNDEIRRLGREGVSNPRLSRQYNLTVRRIRQIINSAPRRRDDPQFDLFSNYKN